MANGLEGWKVWLRMVHRDMATRTCNKSKAGRDTPHRQEGKLVRFHRRQTQHEFGRLYDLLKNFCSRSTHASNTPRCHFPEGARTFCRSVSVTSHRGQSNAGSLVTMLKHLQEKQGRYSHFIGLYRKLETSPRT